MEKIHQKIQNQRFSCTRTSSRVENHIAVFYIIVFFMEKISTVSPGIKIKYLHILNNHAQSLPAQVSMSQPMVQKGRSLASPIPEESSHKMQQTETTGYRTINSCPKSVRPDSCLATGERRSEIQTKNIENPYNLKPIDLPEFLDDFKDDMNECLGIWLKKVKERPRDAIPLFVETVCEHMPKSFGTCKNGNLCYLGRLTKNLIAIKLPSRISRMRMLNILIDYALKNLHIAFCHNTEFVYNMGCKSVGIDDEDRDGIKSREQLKALDDWFKQYTLRYFKLHAYFPINHDFKDDPYGERPVKEREDLHRGARQHALRFMSAALAKSQGFYHKKNLNILQNVMSESCVPVSNRRVKII